MLASSTDGWPARKGIPIREYLSGSWSPMGDEGKAKVVDQLAEQAQWVVRSQGGCNAGHTVCHEGETFKFHHLPSGLLYGDTNCIIGSGTVLSPEILQQEMEAIQARGYSLDRLKISERAHLTLPYHRLQDRWQEQQRGSGKIGTTGRGIGPTYMDKVGRMGLRVIDLFEDEAYLKERLTNILAVKPHLSEAIEDAEESLKQSLELDFLLDRCRVYRELLAPYVADTQALLQEAHQKGEAILLEGAQGTLLDIDFGTYPYVTSSNATAGGACTGTGLGPTQVQGSLGVMKAYLTRVGEGPFPSEDKGDAGRFLSEKGHEFGTTTGRARRCGWFDAVIGRYSVEVNGLSGLAITKVDVLDELESIPVCVAYQDPQTGQRYERFPAQISLLSRLEPVFETLPGWQESTEGCRRFEDLPSACQTYLNRLAELCGCALWMVSVGPDRAQTIYRTQPFNAEQLSPSATPALS